MQKLGREMGITLITWFRQPSERLRKFERCLNDTVIAYKGSDADIASRP